jgi:putative transposase
LKPSGGTPRIGGKNGSKRHVLVDERGVPQSLVVTGANRHDVTQLDAVLQNRIRLPPEQTVQNLCADKGYIGGPAQLIILSHGYVPPVKERGEKTSKMKNEFGYQPRRWIVELTHSWLNRFRKLLVRYEKKACSYEALVHLALAIICWRKINNGFMIYG